MAKQFGLNVPPTNYYSTFLLFVDLMNACKEWHSRPSTGGEWNDKRGIIEGPDGWPASLASDQHAVTLMCRDIGGHYPAGDYVCLYDGKGEIELDYDASVISSEPGRKVVRVADPSDNGIYLAITRTDPADPIRNVRLIMPGFEEVYQEQPFWPPALALLAGAACLRFMQGAGINTSAYKPWDQRITRDYYTQGGERGISLDYQIQLANTLRANLWTCMHHLASLQDVREAGQKLKSELAAGLRVFVEDSNERWNSIFACNKWFRKQGLAAGLASNEWTAGTYFYGQHAEQVFTTLLDVFGEESDRLITVVSGQAGNEWQTSAVLKRGNLAKVTKAISIAPYAGGELGAAARQDQTAGMSLDQLFTELEKDLAECIQQTKAHRELADQYGLQLVGYEMGQHLAGVGAAQENNKITALFIAANRDPRMAEIYHQYLADWEAAGGELGCLFALMGKYSKYGSWGLLEHHDQLILNAPKAQAYYSAIGVDWMVLDGLAVPMLPESPEQSPELPATTDPEPQPEPDAGTSVPDEDVPEASAETHDHLTAIADGLDDTVLKLAQLSVSLQNLADHLKEPQL